MTASNDKVAPATSIEEWDQGWLLPYMNQEATLAAPFIRDKSIVIDVGANTGMWTNAVLNLLPANTVPGGDILFYLFEPVYDYAKACARRFKDDPRVLTFNYALSYDEAHYAIYKDSTNLGWNTLYPTMATPTHPELGPMTIETVKTVSLDSIHLDLLKPDASLSFMKIDVEGWEWSVLRGARKTISTFKPAIQLEIGWGIHDHPDWPLEVAELRYLQSIGYDVPEHLYAVDRTTNVLLLPASKP